MNHQSRRKFMTKTAKAAGVLPFMAFKVPDLTPVQSEKTLHISIFSKHLQFLDYQEMAEMAAQIGFDGVDLTVRPKGHVLPEKVEQDLPRAIEAIENAGFEPLMMTTGVDDAGDQVDQTVLKTAAGLGMKIYRMGYFRYTKDGNIPTDVNHFQKRVQALGTLNKSLGLVGCYQNHAGNYVGASMFELFEIFNNADPLAAGIQYDIRHATVEGGKSWETGLRLVKPRIKSIVLKDFRWEKNDGVWDTINTPLGEGMVDFKKYFGILKQYQINVPVTMHFEYDLGGANHGDREISINPEKVYEAMRKDLDFARKTWDES